MKSVSVKFTEKYPKKTTRVRRMSGYMSTAMCSQIRNSTARTAYTEKYPKKTARFRRMSGDMSTAMCSQIQKKRKKTAAF